MSKEFTITIYYKYTPVADPVGFMYWHRLTCERLGLKGRILIAKEGINGTFEGETENVKQYKDALHAQNGSTGTFGDFSDVWFKDSPGTGHAFPKLKIKVRNEIVTTGLKPNEDVSPLVDTGTHLNAEELKQWYENGEEFEIIDMRNDYEFAVGHFKGSRYSGMQNFRDLSAVPKNFEQLKDKKVLTVCTYGVRCEKASAYLKQQGFKNVYQLNGGIGTYMKTYPGEDFDGSLYVFDDRITERFTDTYPVIGQCHVCHTPCERFGNCALDECHKQLIICESCSTQPVFCRAEHAK